MRVRIRKKPSVMYDKFGIILDGLTFEITLSSSCILLTDKCSYFCSRLRKILEEYLEGREYSAENEIEALSLFVSEIISRFKKEEYKREVILLFTLEMWKMKDVALVRSFLEYLFKHFNPNSLGVYAIELYIYLADSIGLSFGVVDEKRKYLMLYFAGKRETEVKKIQISKIEAIDISDDVVIPLHKFAEEYARGRAVLISPEEYREQILSYILFS